MVWGAFSGEVGRAGLYFLHKNKWLHLHESIGGTQLVSYSWL